MTTRHSGYLVVLADPVREDSDQNIRTALSMVSGVVSVEPVPDDLTTAMARSQIRSKLRQRAVQAIDAVFDRE